MNIFLSLHPSGNSSVPNSMTWYYNLYEPLLDLGHEVYLIRIDETAKLLNVKFATSKFKEKFSNNVVNEIENIYKKLFWSNSE